ncbi:anomalous homeobox protein-like [Tenrec ecaudatus]|uniref:anomalous homeobox protein-like n=1 Tax=Tenrec ecaudatus TaxID=94439 RepID=UPI003F5A352D
MQRFLTLLEESESRPDWPPQAELVALAGRLCRDLEDDLDQAEHLVDAVLRSPLRLYLLESEAVVLVCVLVLDRREQHQEACKLLEGCRVPGGSLDLVEAWNDIHYHMTMRRLGVDTLSPLQTFRCRKKNPPPPSLCPEGLRSRHFPGDVRKKLRDFALAVSTYPDKAQRDTLSLETSLSAEQVYNWFANYRRRQKALLQRSEPDLGTATQDGPAVCGSAPKLPCSPGDPCANLEGVVRPQWPGFTDMPRGSPQAMCLEEGPGTSVEHVELQAGSFLVTQPALPPLEFMLPQRPELAQAVSYFPGVTSAVELSPPLLTGQVQRPAGQASSDAVWGVQMLCEFSGSSLD